MTIARVTFNTGRLYTKEGQIVTAELRDNRTVAFDDHSRMIWGEFQLSEFSLGDTIWPRDPEAFARCVMKEYDAHRYTMGSNGLKAEPTIHQFRI